MPRSARINLLHNRSSLSNHDFFSSLLGGFGRTLAESGDGFVNFASEARTAHILTGDARGCSHMFHGLPGETAFPELCESTILEPAVPVGDGEGACNYPTAQPKQACSLPRR